MRRGRCGVQEQLWQLWQQVKGERLGYTRRQRTVTDITNASRRRVCSSGVSAVDGGRDVAQLRAPKPKQCRPKRARPSGCSLLQHGRANSDSRPRLGPAPPPRFSSTCVHSAAIVIAAAARRRQREKIRRPPSDSRARTSTVHNLSQAELRPPAPTNSPTRSNVRHRPTRTQPAHPARSRSQPTTGLLTPCHPACRCRCRLPRPF